LCKHYFLLFFFSINETIKGNINKIIAIIILAIIMTVFVIQKLILITIYFATSLVFGL